jgi:hypothetical protein
MNKKGLMSPVNHKFDSKFGIKYEEEGRREGPPAYGGAPAKAGEVNKKGLMSPVNRKFEFGIKYEEEGRRGATGLRQSGRQSRDRIRRCPG